MSKTLVVYRDDAIVKEEPKNPNGKTTVTIDGLESNTSYNAGTFKISWKNENGESKKVDVPAFKTDAVGVTSIAVSNEAVTLDVGSQSQIDVSVAPSNADNKGVTYTSNNNPVATVTDNGLIEAVKSGSATITVKSVDNAQAIAKVRVTVEETPVEETPVEEPPVEEPPTE